MRIVRLPGTSASPDLLILPSIYHRSLCVPEMDYDDMILDIYNKTDNKTDNKADNKADKHDIHDDNNEMLTVFNSDNRNTDDR